MFSSWFCVDNYFENIMTKERDPAFENRVNRIMHFENFARSALRKLDEYEEALKFYADTRKYHRKHMIGFEANSEVEDDRGDLARKVLGK